ncbi:tRNA lysidine(34) synthetase TilS [Roseibacillus persicicus]|uniref:tRNA lysidine(34) synthetase TilS n=1 Tax=Roseibacillus persicicus TaxID=454148 RepID=UPI00280F7511|nr:tRNA lysidine(34) synthetase TilS [Roseibacillus persicicus]MDQ8190640.1 tRNA lysidine(34) synthetase TilS [Roseibacillus persicicus]
MLDLTLISPDTTYLLGLSGGRDSVCLLHLLLENHFRNLHLVHLNHQLRGADADADELFVKDLARQLELPLTHSRLPVGELAAANGLSIETAARNARHQLFAEVAAETGTSSVLLAHHAEDQAETILFNLLRGSSGPRGMKPETTLAVGPEQLRILRPLLQARRKNIDSYLENRKIEFREDSSNQDPAHTRNRFRNEVMPLLTEIMGRDIIPPLIRAAGSSDEKDHILDQLLQTLDLLDPQGRLFLPKLRELAPGLQLACLKEYLRKNEVQEISNRLLKEARTLIASQGPPAINLPGNRHLRRRQGRIFIC